MRVVGEADGGRGGGFAGVGRRGSGVCALRGPCGRRCQRGLAGGRRGGGRPRLHHRASGALPGGG
eukprot:10119088-Lingulodinium_polyedra.AAC.1